MSRAVDAVISRDPLSNPSVRVRACCGNVPGLDAASGDARLIFGAMFLMTTSFKFTGMEGTAGYIASIGFPFPLFFAWVAALFELGLALAFWTGGVLYRSGGAGRCLCAVPCPGFPWTVASADKPDGVRLLH